MLQTISTPGARCSEMDLTMVQKTMGALYTQQWFTSLDTIYIYLEHATFIHFKAVLKVWNEDPSQTFANDSITKLHACCLEWCSRTCRMTVVSASDIFMDQQHDHSYRKKLHHPWQVITCGFRISHLINLDLILGRAVAASWDKEEAPNRYVPITLYYIAFNCFPIAFNCF